MKGILKKPVFHCMLTALLGLLAYSNTFNVPFQWDEDKFIAENPIVKDISYFAHPSRAEGLKLSGGSDVYALLKNRYIGYLTFALNYKLHGLDVRGYHAVNLFIHILNALFVYFLVSLTYRTPFLSNASSKEHSGYISLFTALIFVAHPVQTEAVTYIFQRLASLAAMFYLLSLVLYISSRLSAGKTKRYSLYAVSLISAVLAMKTKENAFTLPIAITIYEFFFFTGSIKHRMPRLIPFFFVMLIIPLTLIVGTEKYIDGVIGALGAASRGEERITRLDYLFTQFRVVVKYIRLLFLPINQNINYDYHIFRSFFAGEVLASFSFLSAILIFTLYMLYRSKYVLWMRLPAFGILWFFIALSVESSIVPLPMVINEYRVYLPSVGAILTFTSGMLLPLIRLQRKTVPHAILIVAFLVPLSLSYVTFKRNAVWKTGVSLWEDTLNKNPVATVHFNLALAYAGESRFDKAIEHFSAASSINPDNPDPHYNIGLAYYNKGMVDEAIEHFKIALKLRPDYPGVHVNLGLSYQAINMTDKALEHFREALRINRDSVEAHINLGVLYKKMGAFKEAIEHLQTAVRLCPDSAEAHNNLANTFSSIGLHEKALEHYLIAIKFHPEDADINFNIGLAYLKMGRLPEALKSFEQSLKIKPDRPEAAQYVDRLRHLKTIP